jgi:hypothetical protein
MKKLNRELCCVSYSSKSKCRNPREICIFVFLGYDLEKLNREQSSYL